MGTRVDPERSEGRPQRGCWPPCSLAPLPGRAAARPGSGRSRVGGGTEVTGRAGSGSGRLRLLGMVVGRYPAGGGGLTGAGRGQRAASLGQRAANDGRRGGEFEGVAGGRGGGAGRRRAGGKRGVAQDLLDLDVLAQPGRTTLHQRAQGMAAATGAAGPGRDAASGGGRRSRALALMTRSARITAGSRFCASSSSTKQATGASLPSSARSRACRARLTRRRRWVSTGSARRALVSSTDDGAEVRAFQHAPDHGLAAAFGQGRGAGRQSGGEAVGEPEPVSGVRALARPAEQGRHEQGRVGRGAVEEGGAHGSRYRGILSLPQARRAATLTGCS
jgi:hypothetical protein